MGDFLPPNVLGVVRETVRAQLGGGDMAARRRVERSDWMVADSDVDEILLDELTDAGDIRIVELFVQHRTAVTSETTGPAGSVGRRGEEELSSADLSGREGAVIPGQEFVEWRVTGDHGS